ncbi:hypothetical protein CFP65_2192 [Kitasatospora sp. MMS16-BH015]|uniref:hypothetical protein n=1 Tax=Kitasatospora sp. MMS16-BH015 TaxID=2018025 RepID=UPI000CA38AF1|nr:hypothetical protein [Kitasatospora sp. MMS16-BH015]AUG77039.1 hypothetical protein CFP65_2192 [Kitasatospora sp. MMS16-BH015]
MTSRFADVLTRSGPGYELSPPAELPPRETVWGRILDAATHRGPGYCPATAEELADAEAAARHAKARLVDFLRTSFGRILAAQEALDAMDSASGPRAEGYRISAEYELRGFLDYFHAEWPPAVAALREATGPLDFRARRLIARLTRLQNNSVRQMERLADELAHAPAPTDPPHRYATHVTAGEVRSLASLLHATVH